MGVFDLFKKPTKKEASRENMNRNRRNGKDFENRQDAYHNMLGRKVEKLRKGPDRKITETNVITGKKKVWYEEYKSSKTAPLRKSQKEFKKKHPGKMKVIRPYDPLDSFRTQKQKPLKRKNSLGDWEIGF